MLEDVTDSILTLASPRLLRVKQFAKTHPAFPESSLRWLIHKTSPARSTSDPAIPAGLGDAFIRFAGRVYIDEGKFFDCLKQNNARKPLIALLKRTLEPIISEDVPMDLKALNDSHPRAAAIAYCEIGWPVVIVHGLAPTGICTCGKPDCHSPGKHPIQKEWQKNPLNTTVDIHTQFDQHPHANIGVLTGPSSGLVVLDIDSKTGLDASDVLAKTEAQFGKLPKTLTCQTGGGGVHLYFKYPPDMKISNSAGKIAANFDVRGDGGFVVAAPSRHSSGGTYQWSC